MVYIKHLEPDDGIFISQDKYVADILKKFDFVTVKTTSTPIQTNKALLKDEEAEDVDVYLYRSMIGSLMYLTTSGPDIMFAVCACARFRVTPKVSHLHALRLLIRSGRQMNKGATSASSLEVRKERTLVGHACKLLLLEVQKLNLGLRAALFMINDSSLSRR
ncbi:hypothetical protein Tco_1500849 [Tanacetum coccineum]